jgi:hypothetical protein
MTPPVNHPAHSTIANGNRPRGAALASSRQARAQRVFDGVVASYIRDISVRAASNGRPHTSA